MLIMARNWYFFQRFQLVTIGIKRFPEGTSPRLARHHPLADGQDAYRCPHVKPDQETLPRALCQHQHTPLPAAGRCRGRVLRAEALEAVDPPAARQRGQVAGRRVSGSSKARSKVKQIVT